MSEFYQRAENSSQGIGAGYGESLAECCMPEDLPVSRTRCNGKTSAEEESKAGADGKICLLRECIVFNGYVVQRRVEEVVANGKS